MLHSWLHLLSHCPSTNTWAKENIDQLPHGAVIFTRHQTAGRGQQGRAWYAPPGVLTASFVLGPLSGHNLSGFTLVAGLAVIYAVEDLSPNLSGILGLKWPNDIYVRGLKLAGILSEVVPQNQMQDLIVGVGLNRSLKLTQAQASYPELSQAISLNQLTQSLPGDIELVEKIRSYLLQAISVFPIRGLAPFLDELNRRDVLKGQPLTVLLPDGQLVKGLGAGIDQQGQLNLTQANGEVISIRSGHIQFDCN